MAHLVILISTLQSNQKCLGLAGEEMRQNMAGSLLCWDPLAKTSNFRTLGSKAIGSFLGPVGAPGMSGLYLAVPSFWNASISPPHQGKSF